MPRSALKIIISLFALTAVFIGYLALQPEGPKTISSTQPVSNPTTLSTRQEVDGIAGGEGVWVAQYEEKTGELVSRFKADEYDPQDGDVVNVRNAYAEFVLSDGQLLRIHGVRGSVVVPKASGALGKPSFMRDKARLPARGRLEDVTIHLLKSSDESVPMIIARMNNVAFDNDTFRIYTDAFTDASGQRVEGKDVQIDVKGDYEFNGYGLIVRWNQRDRHLERLEINRGERLVIKNLAGFASNGLGLRGEENNFSDTVARSTSLDPRRILRRAIKESSLSFPPNALVDASGDATGEAIATGEPAGLLYRATFFDDVVLTQAPSTRISATQMTIAFNPESAPRAGTQPSSTRTTNPVTRPSTSMPASETSERETASPSDISRQSAAQAFEVSGKEAGLDISGSGSSQTTGIHDRGSRIPNAPTTGSSEPALIFSPESPDKLASSLDAIADRAEGATPASPATSPATEVVVSWRGKLVVEPVRAGQPRPQLAPGDSLVTLTGSPVAFSSETSRGTCEALHYATADASVTMHGSEKVPLVLQGANETHITTQTLRFSRQDRIATLAGKSAMAVPVTAADGAQQMLQAAWTETCVLDLAEGAGDSFSPRHARIVGNVHVTHPQLILDGDSLEMEFDPAPANGPTTRGSTDAPAMRQLTVRGNVDCTLTGQDGQAGKLAADELILSTELDAFGKPYPAIVRANGGVRASDGMQSLSADHLLLTLAPPAETDGSAATDKVEREGVSPENALPSTSVTDSPPTSQPSSVLFAMQSNQIRAVSATGHVIVKGVDDQSASADELEMVTNEMGTAIELRAKAGATVVSKDGRLTGPLIRVRPEDQSAVVEGAGTLSTTLAGGPVDTGKAFDVSWSKSLDYDGLINIATVDGDVVITHASSDGSLNTGTGQRVILSLADAPATQPATPSSGAAQSPFNEKQVTLARIEQKVQMRSVLADTEGSILRQVNLFAESIEYDIPAQKITVPVPGKLFYADLRQDPATTKPAGGAPLAEKSGSTAVAWQKSLVVDQANQVATLQGEVVVVRQGLEENAAPVRLDADTVLATFRKPTSKNDSRRAELTQLQAIGKPMRFAGRGTRFEAAVVTYDPVTQIATARGSEEVQAMFYDDRALSQGTFSELQYHLQTQKTSAKDFRAVARPESGVELQKKP